MERPRTFVTKRSGSPSYTVIEGGNHGELQQRQRPQLLQHIQLGGPHDAAVSRSTGETAVATSSTSSVYNGGEVAVVCTVDRGLEEENIGPRGHLEEETPNQMATHKKTALVSAAATGGVLDERQSNHGNLELFGGVCGGQPAPASPQRQQQQHATLMGEVRRRRATDDVDGTGSLVEELWGGGSAETAAVLPPSPTSFKVGSDVHGIGGGRGWRRRGVLM